VLTVKRRAGAIWDVVDGTLTVCDTTSGELFELNETGRRIWESCEGRTLDAIADDIHRTFPGQRRSLLEEDLQRYVRMLEESRLLDVVDVVAEERGS
jgi:hypothetical protein